MSSRAALVLRRLLRLVLALTVGLALWLWAGLPGEAPAPPAGSLRVAAANLLYMQKSSADIDAALTALRADVLVLVELTANNADLEALEASGLQVLAARPYQGSRGAALLVREDIEGEAEVIEPPWKSTCRAYTVVGRLRLPEPLAVLGVHAPPPVKSCEPGGDVGLVALAGLVSEGRLTRDIGPAHAGDPVLIAGDLNALPFQPGLWRLRRAGLRDALLTGTPWPTPTWPALRGGLALGRIDAIWAPPGLDVVGAGNFVIPGSDHHGVYADLQRVGGDDASEQ